MTVSPVYRRPVTNWRCIRSGPPRVRLAWVWERPRTRAVGRVESRTSAWASGRRGARAPCVEKKDFRQLLCEDRSAMWERLLRAVTGVERACGHVLFKVSSIHLRPNHSNRAEGPTHIHSHPAPYPALNITRWHWCCAAITTVAAPCSLLVRLASRPMVLRLGRIADALGPRTALASPSARQSTKRIARPTQPALPRARLGIARAESPL